MVPSSDSSLDGLGLDTSSSNVQSKVVGSGLDELNLNDATVPYDDLFQDLIVGDLDGDALYKHEPSHGTSSNGSFNEIKKQKDKKGEDKSPDIVDTGKRSLRKRNKSQSDVSDKSSPGKSSHTTGKLSSKDRSPSDQADLKLKTRGRKKNTKVESPETKVEERKEKAKEHGRNTDVSEVVEEDVDAADSLNSSELIRTRRGSSIIISIKPDLDENEEPVDEIAATNTTEESLNNIAIIGADEKSSNISSCANNGASAPDEKKGLPVAGENESET